MLRCHTDEAETDARALADEARQPAHAPASMIHFREIREQYLVLASLAVANAFLLTGSVLAQESQVALRVAVTVDDVPHVGGATSLPDARRVTAAMTAALEKHGAPAAGFVTGRRGTARGWRR